MKVKRGLITRSQRKKLKLQEDNNMFAYLMEALKCKDDEYMKFNCSSQFLLLIESRVRVLDSIDLRSSRCMIGVLRYLLPQGFNHQTGKSLDLSMLGFVRHCSSQVLHWKLELQILNEGLIMSTDDHMPTHYYQEGTSEPSMRQVTETMLSLQQTVEGLARQNQSVARDIKEPKKGKNSTYLSSCRTQPAGATFFPPQSSSPHRDVSPLLLTSPHIAVWPAPTHRPPLSTTSTPPHLCAPLQLTSQIR
ncbi:hypothetical protein M9H77_12995 [Catharanthus roseus]|uniref:Uncharacterized protein n=1 Tax=Catharanthus roseus TaxID=4058 RepID=A0ACC0BIZ1_CATRO|nr:hypothetical protein M9H77_12995 [Catharanthus roseus]